MALSEKFFNFSHALNNLLNLWKITMSAICFYFQVHQPYRLRHYTVFDMGQSHFYEDDKANGEILWKVANKCYLPMNKVLLDLINKHEGKFKISFSLSGVVMEQLSIWAPEVLQSFQELVKTGCVELLSETYAHSLSALYSEEEFNQQVQLHSDMLEKFFAVKPKVFRNTELIYSNRIAKMVEKLGYKAILAEGADHILGWRTPNIVYQPANCLNLKLLLKNYQLSDDIAFRFSNRGWAEFPLTADKFANWVHTAGLKGEVINLFMDYETFGEHQWEDSGIFEFMKVLPEKIMENKNFKFLTPSEVAENIDPMARLDIPEEISWADLERDLTAWLGNDMQHDAIESVYRLEKEVLASNDQEILKTWRHLQTSDHFYYMCTKWFSDGDVHKYFNPYDSPYDAYINYMNVLADFEQTLEKKV